jgi:hypothetical protein
LNDRKKGGSKKWVKHRSTHHRSTSEKNGARPSGPWPATAPIASPRLPGSARPRKPPRESNPPNDCPPRAPSRSPSPSVQHGGSAIVHRPWCLVKQCGSECTCLPERWRHVPGRVVLTIDPGKPPESVAGGKCHIEATINPQIAMATRFSRTALSDVRTATAKHGTKVLRGLTSNPPIIFKLVMCKSSIRIRILGRCRRIFGEQGGAFYGHAGRAARPRPLQPVLAQPPRHPAERLSLRPSGQRRNFARPSAECTPNSFPQYSHFMDSAPEKIPLERDVFR